MELAAWLRWPAWSRAALRGSMLGLGVIGLGLGGCGEADAGAGPGENRIDALIRADPYPRLVIELDAVEGRSPRADALDHAVQELAGLVDKPLGIEVVVDELLPPQAEEDPWTESGISALAQAHINSPVDQDTIRIHILAIDGVYASSVTDDTTTVGLAWGGTHIVLFMDSIREICAGDDIPVTLRDDLCHVTEQSVILHEIGHLLGLVNHGLPMAAEHEDPDHPHHCANEGCVMYWCYERIHALRALRDRFMAGDSEFGTFDSSCRADVSSLLDDPSPLSVSGAGEAMGDIWETPYACELARDAH